LNRLVVKIMAGAAAASKHMKYVVVTGGVVSGLGKGITISSLGLLLKLSGIRVTSIKIDPYLVRTWAGARARVPRYDWPSALLDCSGFLCMPLSVVR
jgi:hypothetical protein